MKRAGSYNKNVCAIFIAVSLVCLLMSASAYASTDRFSDIPLKMKMTTDIPESILTPDAVQTRLGTLEFFDGYPSADTVEIVYEILMFMRGIQTFLNCVPIASMEAMRAGMHDVLSVGRSEVVGRRQPPWDCSGRSPWGKLDGTDATSRL